METKEINLKKDEYRKPLTIFEVIKANLTLNSEATSTVEPTSTKPLVKKEEEDKPAEFLFPISALF